MCLKAGDLIVRVSIAPVVRPDRGGPRDAPWRAYETASVLAEMLADSIARMLAPNPSFFVSSSALFRELTVALPSSQSELVPA